MSQKCPSCNEDVTGMKFCGSCGTKTPPPQCTQCFQELSPLAKFCAQCGAGREVKSPANVVVVEPPMKTVEGPSSSRPIESTPRAVTETSSERAESKEESAGIDAGGLGGEKTLILVKNSTTGDEIKKNVGAELTKAVPEAPKAVSEVTNAAPQATKAMPEASKAVPEASKAVPESPKAVPESPKAVLESPKTVPESSKAVAESDAAAVESPRAATSTDSRDRSETDSTAGEKTKKTFSVRASPPCNVCQKPVYKMEEALDSTGLIFHKDHFRCKVCKADLSGRQRIPEPEVNTPKLTTRQYLVAKENSGLGQKGEFFCEKHTIKVGVEVTKAQDISQVAKDEGELKRVASMRKDDNQNVRMSMESRMGDAIPKCTRCGFPIEKNQPAMVSGMERYHAAGCPTKEEADKTIRNVRFFIKKAPDRLVGLFSCDKDTKLMYTFMFELDKNALVDMLRKKANESVSMIYNPDATARTAASRKLVPPTSEAARLFDISFKEFFDFSFKNPKNNDAVKTPMMDVENKTLVLTKYCHANGVLQTLEARFKYDEASKLCSAERIDLFMEMWPVEAAAEMGAQLDPLANLKSQLKGENPTPTVEVPVPSEAGAVAAAADKAAAAAGIAATDGSKKKKGGCVIS